MHSLSSLALLFWFFVTIKNEKKQFKRLFFYTFMGPSWSEATQPLASSQTTRSSSNKSMSELVFPFFSLILNTQIVITFFFFSDSLWCPTAKRGCFLGPSKIRNANRLVYFSLCRNNMILVWHVTPIGYAHHTLILYIIDGGVCWVCSVPIPTKNHFFFPLAPLIFQCYVSRRPRLQRMNTQKVNGRIAFICCGRFVNTTRVYTGLIILKVATGIRTPRWRCRKKKAEKKCKIQSRAEYGGRDRGKRIFALTSTQHS